MLFFWTVITKPICFVVYHQTHRFTVNTSALVCDDANAALPPSFNRSVIPPRGLHHTRSIHDENLPISRWQAGFGALSSQLA